MGPRRAAGWEQVAPRDLLVTRVLLDGVPYGSSGDEVGAREVATGEPVWSGTLFGMSEGGSVVTLG